MDSRSSLLSALSIAPLVALVLAVLPAAGAVANPGPIDLSLRSTVYATGPSTVIDQATDPSVVADGSMTVDSSDATACTVRGCTFNLGFTAMRTVRGATWDAYATSFPTFATMSCHASSAGSPLAFDPDEIEHEGNVPLFLAFGPNEVTLRIDPYNKTAESDESNNSLRFTIVVRKHT